jgi:hypothetical protein
MIDVNVCSNNMKSGGAVKETPLLIRAVVRLVVLISCDQTAFLGNPCQPISCPNRAHLRKIGPKVLLLQQLAN